MQIVIDIDGEDILFPKGHGRLIDDKDVIENICEMYGCDEDRRNNCKSKLYSKKYSPIMH